MPIIKSSAKRDKTSKVNAKRNKPVKTRFLTMVKNIIAWATEGNKEKVNAHFNEAQKAVDMAAKKNIIHKNKAARAKSQLAAAKQAVAA